MTYTIYVLDDHVRIYINPRNLVNKIADFIESKKLSTEVIETRFPIGEEKGIIILKQNKDFLFDSKVIYNLLEDCLKKYIEMYLTEV